MSVEMSTQAWRTKTRTCTQKLVLLALADHADPEGYSFPGVNLIAEKVGTRKRAVQTIISEFQDLGILEVTPRYDRNGRQQSNYYRLHLSGEGAPQNTGRVHHGASPRVHHSAPLEPSEEPSNESIPPRDGGSPIKGVDCSGLEALVTGQVLKDFLYYRKTVKKSPITTQTQVTRMVNELQRCRQQGISPDEALAEAMAANWVGFKADWLKRRLYDGPQAYQHSPGRKESTTERAEREEQEYLSQFRDDGKAGAGNGETLDADDPDLR